MELDTVLMDARSDVLDEACAALARCHASHYEDSGEAATRQRLGDLFELTVSAIRTRDLAEIGSYAERLARDRFEQGYDIAEVQTAFNALEEAMWRRVVRAEPPHELAEAVGLLSTVLGYAKDVMARTYVSLASARHVPSLDLSALFSGVES